jgi:hypothetical protein
VAQHWCASIRRRPLTTHRSVEPRTGRLSDPQHRTPRRETEREILRKAAAYFAQETIRSAASGSSPSTDTSTASSGSVGSWESRDRGYAWLGRPPSARSVSDAELAGMIVEIHDRSRRTYGAPRVHAELARLGRRCGRKRVARLMRSQQLVGVHARRRWRHNRAHSASNASNGLNEPGLVGAGWAIGSRPFLRGRRRRSDSRSRSASRSASRSRDFSSGSDRDRTGIDGEGTGIGRDGDPDRRDERRAVAAEAWGDREETGTGIAGMSAGQVVISVPVLAERPG